MSIDESTMSATEATVGTEKAVLSNGEATISGGESVTDKKKRPTPAEQDVELANFISQSRVTKASLRNRPDLLGRSPTP